MSLLPMHPHQSGTCGCESGHQQPGRPLVCCGSYRQCSWDNRQKWISHSPLASVILNCAVQRYITSAGFCTHILAAAFGGFNEAVQAWAEPESQQGGTPVTAAIVGQSCGDYPV